MLTTALCSLIAVIEAVIASCKMTFPLLFWRDELHSVAFSLSLSLSAAAFYDSPERVFINSRDGKDVCEYPGKSLTLLLNSVIFKLGNKVGVMKHFFSVSSLTCHSRRNTGANN